MTTITTTNSAIININEAGNILSALHIDENLPLNQRIQQCADIFLQSKAIEKYASEYIISSLNVSTTEELMKRLDELQMWPGDWKMPRSVYNALDKGTPSYVVKDDGFVEYKRSNIRVSYAFIVAFARVYNLLEKRQCKAAAALQALMKDADIALSSLFDTVSENDISSRLTYAEKCIELLPIDKQDEYIKKIYCILDKKREVFFPVVKKTSTVGGLQYTGQILDYDACFFDALLFSYIPAVYDEYSDDNKPPVEIYETEACRKYFDIYIPALIKRLAQEKKEIQEQAEKIARERLAKEGIHNALLLEKYKRALQDIETAVNKLSVDVSKAKRQDCNIALNAIRQALKEAVL